MAPPGANASRPKYTDTATHTRRNRRGGLAGASSMSIASVNRLFPPPAVFRRCSGPIGSKCDGRIDQCDNQRRCSGSQACRDPSCPGRQTAGSDFPIIQPLIGSAVTAGRTKTKKSESQIASSLTPADDRTRNQSHHKQQRHPAASQMRREVCPYYLALRPTVRSTGMLSESTRRRAPAPRPATSSRRKLFAD